jgi:hypothetical protein
MGFFKAISDIRMLAVSRSYKEQLAEGKAKGLTEAQSAAALIVSVWQLPASDDTFARALRVSNALGEQLVIGLLMFTKRIGVKKDLKQQLLTDPFHHLHGCLFHTAGPLSRFANKYINRIWKKQHVSPPDAVDAAFAAFYATMIVPIAVDAWMMLAEFKEMGFCPEIDTRDHLKEGIDGARRFLESAKSIDPQFRSMLTEGIRHMTDMQQKCHA